MKAAVLVKNGDAASAFELRDVPKPQPKAQEVLIKVEGFGLNFADVMARNGIYPDAPPLPSILGYDVCGEVVEVGADVDNTWVGKRVTAMTRFGGYAQFVATDLKGVAEISDQLSTGAGAALATQYCTAWYSACEMMNLYEGDTILIHAAAGGVGTAVTQIAKMRGCTVVGTTSSNAKFDYLKSIGVDHPINYKDNDYVEEITKLLGKRPLDATFNSIGGKTFKKDMSLLNNGGRVCCYGAAERAGKANNIFTKLKFVWNFGFYTPIALIMGSRAVLGVNMLRIADNKPEALKRCLVEVARLASDGTLKPTVGGEFPAEEIGKAHAFLESRKSTGKIIVKW